MVRSLRLAAAATILGATVLGATAFGTTAASAHGFGGGFGNFHAGFHGAGIHLGGWGHSWGYRRIGFRPAFGGCYIQRYVNVYGGINWQRVCY